MARQRWQYNEYNGQRFGKAPYSVRSVSNDGNYTVVTISVNGGRSINTLTFDNNNPNYMMLNNVSTGYSADYVRVG